MARFTKSDELREAQFTGTDLRGARFVGADLSGVVMRGVEVQGMDVDSPWLFDDGGSIRVNGVDVMPYVEAELDRRFPGRALWRADDPAGLREAWAAAERAWAAVVERAAVMPAGAVEMSVGGEWSLAQTFRHLVFATDMWLGKAILRLERPFHPIGQLDDSTAEDGLEVSAATAAPSYEEVLAVRADRVAMVRDYLAAVTAETLASPRPNPHNPGHEETVLSCLHTILMEEWEHLRFAVRDLDSIDRSRPA